MDVEYIINLTLQAIKLHFQNLSLSFITCGQRNRFVLCALFWSNKLCYVFYSNFWEAAVSFLVFYSEFRALNHRIVIDFMDLHFFMVSFQRLCCLSHKIFFPYFENNPEMDTKFSGIRRRDHWSLVPDISSKVCCLHFQSNWVEGIFVSVHKEKAVLVKCNLLLKCR